MGDGRVEFGMLRIPEGVRRDFEQALAGSDLPCESVELGRVIQLDRSLPLVATPRGSVRAEHAIALVKGTDTLAAVGDWAVVGFPAGHDKAVIASLLPRRNSLFRSDSGRKAGKQTLACNIDLVFIVAPAAGISGRLEHLERELSIAYQSGARPVVVLSKADEDPHLDSDAAAALEAAGNAPVVVESCVDGRGIDEVRACIAPGEVGALLGKSGAGKSTLVNMLIGREVQRTREVRASDGKGRHTTIARRMVALPGGGILIDMPGLRSFRLKGTREGVLATFPEIAELAPACRFRDCTHVHEPGCAVLDAVSAGEISRRRHASFVAMMEELSSPSFRRS